MKRLFSWFSSLTIFLFILLVIVPRARADQMTPFEYQMKAISDHRVQVETKLGLIPAEDLYIHASSLYDDKADLYEQDQLMRDVIAQGI